MQIQRAINRFCCYFNGAQSTEIGINFVAGPEIEVCTDSMVRSFAPHRAIHTIRTVHTTHTDRTDRAAHTDRTVARSV